MGAYEFQGLDVTVASTANASTYGQAVTFSATITAPKYTGAYLPSGTASLVIDGKTVQSGKSVSAGKVSFDPVSFLTVSGSPHAVKVVYTTNSSNFVGLLAGGQAVNKATLTITALDQTKVPGAANPTFYLLYSGFVLGQGASVLSGTPKVGTTATSSSPAGTYPITITAGTLTAANYTFKFVPGKLTVLSSSQVVAEMLARQLGLDPTTLSYVNYSQATNNLLAKVSAAGLDQATQNALNGTLQAALAAFNQGNTTAGATQLGAFRTYVKAHRGTTISATLADALTAYAQHILNAVG
jgi:hypothetical protein